MKRHFWRIFRSNKLAIFKTEDGITITIAGVYRRVGFFEWAAEKWAERFNQKEKSD